MNERIKYLGKKAELKKEVNGVMIRLASLRDQIRDKLDPTDAIVEIPAPDVLELTIAFNASQIELKEMLARLKTLNRLLGA